jgi:hypothetical protein
MASTVDLRVLYTGTEPVPPPVQYPDDGMPRCFVTSIKLNVPALIAAGTLAATGLVSGNSYIVLNLPKYSIVKGAWILVRTTDSGGGTVQIQDSSGSVVSYTGALAVSGAGVIGATFTIANITAYNTGGGTDYIKIVIGTANITTAIFDVCVELLKGDTAYNAGTLPNTTGQ